MRTFLKCYNLLAYLIQFYYLLRNRAQKCGYNMKQVDLHVHSTYSDGTNTPSELIAIASSKNLSAIALTDHDTLDGIPDALKAAGNSEVELLPGDE